MGSLQGYYYYCEGSPKGYCKGTIWGTTGFFFCLGPSGFGVSTGFGLGISDCSLGLWGFGLRRLLFSENAVSC